MFPVVPFRVQIDSGVLPRLAELQPPTLAALRAKLEQVAEMSEGFSPLASAWSKRLDVDVTRLQVHVEGLLVHFEIDVPNNTVRVLDVTNEAQNVISPAGS